MTRLLILAFALLTAARAQNPNTAIFPGGTLTDQHLPPAVNRAQTTLTQALDNSATSVTVADASRFPQWSVVTIDSEHVQITAKSGNALTISRGYDGSSAAAHNNGATVTAYILAGHFNQLAAEVKALQAGDFGSRTLKAANAEVGTTCPGGTPAGSVCVSGEFVSLAAGATVETWTPGTAPANPSAGKFKTWMDSADNLMKLLNESGTSTAFSMAGHTHAYSALTGQPTLGTVASKDATAVGGKCAEWSADGSTLGSAANPCGSGIGTASLPYTASVSAQTTLTVTAATHGQGTLPTASCWTNATPAVAAACGYTRAANGDIVFTWSPAFTGTVQIGTAGAKGDPGSSGTSAGANNAVQASDGSGGLKDTGCTASGGVLTCPGGTASGATPPSISGGTAGVFADSEGTPPTLGAAAGVDICYADSTIHGYACSFNNSAYLPMILGPGSSTDGALVGFNGTGGNSLKVITALPSGTTATTQAAADNSTKLATTAYADAAAAARTGTIASGTAVLGTSAIASTACASVVTVAATGVATTDVIQWTPNADISGVTGYAPATAGGLIIYPYPTAGNVNFKICNPTSGSITPGAVTLNWKVVR